MFPSFTHVFLPQPFPSQSKSAPKARAKKEDKVYLDIEARFDRPDRGGRGRGRGDRGEHRGDRGRGTRARGSAARGGRQNGSNAPVVNVDDQTDFPTLS
jgi:plasminogen activator inhibitor 1 RNA-binding protein